MSFEPFLSEVLTRSCGSKAAAMAYEAAAFVRALRDHVAAEQAS